VTSEHTERYCKVSLNECVWQFDRMLRHKLQCNFETCVIVVVVFTIVVIVIAAVVNAILN